MVRLRNGSGRAGWSNSGQRSTSIVPQRRRRVQSRHSQRWHEARDERDGDQEHDDRAERERIRSKERRQPPQKRHNRQRSPDPDNQAGSRQAQPPFEDEPGNARWIRSNGEPYGELTRPRAKRRTRSHRRDRSRTASARARRRDRSATGKDSAPTVSRPPPATSSSRLKKATFGFTSSTAARTEGTIASGRPLVRTMSDMPNSGATPALRLTTDRSSGSGRRSIVPAERRRRRRR